MSHIKRGPDRFGAAKQRVAAAMAASTEEAAKILQAEIVARAPVKTGKLRDAFASPAALARLRAASVWKVGLITKDLRELAHYAAWVEYGTKGYKKGDKRVTKIGKGGKVSTRRMKRMVPPRPAHPFFRPAVEAARPRVKALIAAAVRAALQET
ncbi:HK97-gp10 family putative phage morphogenesis protein [Rhodomicrobium lacus]|uniref:HK97-gp10 family putative phage morphogenesis protein n=1 Tax=Rhodomicrobium lacus TaxID=2498452 RepID=UPI000F8D2FF1|nr:HK97-gp10 family putative phage morphogenesis protein [Rhodomicrobium lacus]